MRCYPAAAVALTSLVLGYACAAQPRSPFFGDERFLVLGVDPSAEADELARQFERNGFQVLLRLRGQHFSALGIAGPDGVPVKVRVVTGRGIALALDATSSDPTQSPVRYALLPSPSAETHDVDGDGFEEVFVHLVPEGLDEPPCIRVYRVRDSGFVDPVAGGTFALPPIPNAEAPWHAPNFCPEPESEHAPDAAAARGDEPRDRGAPPDAAPSTPAATLDAGSPPPR